MISKINHQVNAPIYSYVAALFLYYILKWLDILEGIEWSQQLFNFLVFIAPFLSMFISIYLYSRLMTKRKDIVVFLLGAAPGFIPGAIFGYGLWGMGHGDTIIGFLFNVLIIGLPTAIFFGLLSSLFNFILNKLS